MTNPDLTVLVVDDDFRVAHMHAGIVEAMPGFTVVGTANTLGWPPPARSPRST